MRKHALLQNRLGETQTTGRPGIELFDLDSDAQGRRENRGRVVARTEQTKSDWISGDAFCDNRAKIFAAGRLCRGLLLSRRRMHRAAGGFGSGSLRARGGPDGTVIRESEPRRQRQNHDKGSNRAALHTVGRFAQIAKFAIPPRSRVSGKCFGKRGEWSARPRPENSEGDDDGEKGA